jgi:hypothetical protein
VPSLKTVKPSPPVARKLFRAAKVNVTAGPAILEPLPRGRPPAAMTLQEYIERAFEHGGASFNGVPLQLTGFVAGTQSGGFRLARYQIACCAADASQWWWTSWGRRGHLHATTSG